MGTLKTPGWEARLHRAISAAQARPFAWGSHDCATFAFDLAAELTGQASHADRWRGKYRTALGADRVMRRLGWSDRRMAIEDLLGAPLATVLLAQRGDIVLGSEDAVGICVGAQSVFLGPAGLSSVSLRTCLLAWKV